MIQYSETNRGDILEIVEAGAPDYAELGDLVRVTLVTTHAVTVENRHGLTADFLYNCGAARLSPTKWKDDFAEVDAMSATHCDRNGVDIHEGDWLRHICDTGGDPLYRVSADESGNLFLGDLDPLGMYYTHEYWEIVPEEAT